MNYINVLILIYKIEQFNIIWYNINELQYAFIKLLEIIIGGKLKWKNGQEDLIPKGSGGLI